MGGRRAPRKRYPPVRLHQSRSLVPQGGVGVGGPCAPWFESGPGWFGPYCGVAVRINAWHYDPARKQSVPKVAFPRLPDLVAPWSRERRHPWKPTRDQPEEPFRNWPPPRRLKRRWYYVVELSREGGRRSLWSLRASSPGKACAKARRESAKCGWGRPSDLVVLGVWRERDLDDYADEPSPLDRDPSGPPGWLVRKHDNRE